MKYRNDFVTNSSSSNFLVVFKSVTERNRMFEELKRNYPNYASTIIEDILRSKVSRKEIIDTLKSELESKAYWKYYWGISENWNRGYDINPYQDPNIQAKVKEYVKIELEKILKELPSRGNYAIVCYGDEDGSFYSDLEHEIMPYLDFVFRRINNH